MGNEKNSDRLTWGTRIAYGLGDTAQNVVYGITMGILTLFYTDYCGVSVATVGFVMLLSRIFDGTSDVIMGVIVAKTKSKWGKARPWILWMAVPYAVCTVMMFCVPQSDEMLQFWFIFITYNLVTTVCFTALNIPYGTLSNLMTRSSHERGLLSTVRMGLSPIGQILSVTLTLPFVKAIGNDQPAWIKVMGIWSAIAVVLLIICFVKCKETVSFEELQKKQEKVGVGRSIKALFTNKYFWAVTALWAIKCIHTTIVGTDLPYYCKYVLGDDTLYSFLYTAETLMLIFGAFACIPLLKKFSKKDLALTGAIVTIVSHALIMLNPTSFGWLMAMTIVRSLGQAPLFAVIYGMIGDTVEYGQWKTHVRQDSLIYSGSSLGFKVGTGITSVIMTALLDGAGFVSSSTGGAAQNAAAMEMMGTIYFWGPIIIWAAAIIILILYRLDKQYPKIMEELAEREARGEM